MGTFASSSGRTIVVVVLACIFAQRGMAGWILDVPNVTADVETSAVDGSLRESDGRVGNVVHAQASAGSALGNANGNAYSEVIGNDVLHLHADLAAQSFTGYEYNPSRAALSSATSNLILVPVITFDSPGTLFIGGRVWSSYVQDDDFQGTSRTIFALTGATTVESADTLNPNGGVSLSLDGAFPVQAGTYTVYVESNAGGNGGWPSFHAEGGYDIYVSGSPIPEPSIAAFGALGAMLVLSKARNGVTPGAR